MLLPAARRRDPQLELFPRDRAVSGAGSARYWVGDFFEEATAAVTGAVRFRTDSRCAVCPDLGKRAGDLDYYFEAKATASGKVIVYASRLAKDEALAATVGGRLYYWVWSYRRAAAAGSRDGLRSLLAWAASSVAVVPWTVVHGLVTHTPRKVVNSGAGQDGGGVGWVVPTAAIKAACRARGRTAAATVYGRPFAGRPVLAYGEAELGLLAE